MFKYIHALLNIKINLIRYLLFINHVHLKIFLYVKSKQAKWDNSVMPYMGYKLLNERI